MWGKLRLPNDPPKTVQGLINLACEFRGDILSIIKAYKIWPAIQMKKIGDLIMLYNTYTRQGVENFADLYNECRSVVIHMPTAHIVAAARPIPARVSIRNAPSEGNFEVAYEGTNILVFNHFNKWYFSTTACLSMDNSYFVKNLSHGAMFDEALGISRQEFTAGLDPTKVYSFTLVHHKNTKYTNYDAEFGPEYAKLICTGPSVENIPGPMQFDSVGDAIAYLEATPHAFGVISNSPKPIKITNDAMMKREEVHAGWDNEWSNLLHVYMLERPDYTIHNYASDFSVEANPDEAQQLIDTAMNAVADKIWEYYQNTTNYVLGDERYTMTSAQMTVDASLGQTMRFQLAQLRVLQTRHRRHEYVTREFVGYYLRHYRLVREVSKLMKHMASYAMFKDEPCDEAIVRLGNCLSRGGIKRVID